MSIEKIRMIYFSPTHTTQGVLEKMTTCFHLPTEFIDLTEWQQSDRKLSFSKSDFVIFAFPVYSGRVPELFNERIQQIAGEDTYCAILATYGNRDYDDALIEMKDIATHQGFKTIGALLVVTEHSVVSSVGKGRPNEEDLKLVEQFGTALNKLISLPEALMDDHFLLLPGKRPYRKYRHIPMAPHCTKACISCKLCIKKCPASAITYAKNAVITDTKKCFGCMRCVRECPQGARTVGRLKQVVSTWLLTRLARKTLQSEMFLVETKKR